MKLAKLKGTNIELTEALKNYVNEKMSILEKYLNQVGTPQILDVEIGKTTGHHKNGDVFRAEANLVIPSKQFYAVKESEDLYASIDMMRDEIERQLSEHAKKFREKKIEGGRKAKEELQEL